MKLEIIKTKDNKHIKGWKFIAENDEEKCKLGSIRNAEYFGLGSTAPEYDGCNDEIVTDNNGKEHRYITKIKYKIPKYEEK